MPNKIEDLERMKFSVFKDIPAYKVIKEGLKPTIVTADGVEVMVIMGLEEYAKRLPIKPGGLAMRHQGKLFREV